MFSRSPATTDPGVFSISSPSLVSADVTVADVTIAADGADTRATAGPSSVARTGGSAGAQAVTSAIAPTATGPMRATRPLVKTLQDGNKIASPDRAIRNDWGCRWSGNGCVPWRFHFFAIGREPGRDFDAYLLCCRSLAER